MLLGKSGRCSVARQDDGLDDGLKDGFDDELEDGFDDRLEDRYAVDGNCFQCEQTQTCRIGVNEDAWHSQFWYLPRVPCQSGCRLSAFLKLTKA